MIKIFFFRNVFQKIYDEVKYLLKVATAGSAEARELEKVKRAFDKAYKEGVIDRIFTTNLIYRTPELLSKEWYCEVNMCKYVSYIIDTLNHDNSISGLLNPVQRIHNVVEKHKSAQNGQIKMDI